MPDCTIRQFRSMADAEPQYNLWLAATEGLTRPWRSCLQNVQHQLRQAETYPGCRLYAERPDGTMVGYIGTHPPFDWDAEVHGPPRQPVGWAIPFGLPWTYPRDTDLELALYDEMIRTTPEIYAESQRDIYIQRFRESWTDRLTFLTERGWRLFNRLPLIGRAIDGAQSSPALRQVSESDFELLADLSQRDHTATTMTAAQIEGLCTGGWRSLDAFWRVGEDGAFALEPRGRWAAVTMFFATADAWDDTLHAAAAQASTMGAREIYFTIDETEQALRDALTARDFAEVDAGVYYLRDAD